MNFQSSILGATGSFVDFRFKKQLIDRLKKPETIETEQTEVEEPKEPQNAVEPMESQQTAPQATTLLQSADRSAQKASAAEQRLVSQAVTTRLSKSDLQAIRIHRKLEKQNSYKGGGN